MTYFYFFLILRDEMVEINARYMNKMRKAIRSYCKITHEVVKASRILFHTEHQNTNCQTIKINGYTFGSAFALK